MTETTSRYFFFVLAAAVYALFLAAAAATGLGRRPAPFRRAFLWHGFGALIYLTAGAAWIATRPGAFDWRLCSDALVGLYCYLAFHYAFGLIVLGQAMRGFSVGLCVTLHERGGRATLAELLKNADDGIAAALKRERARVMIECGCARVDAHPEGNPRLTLATRGRWAARANQKLLGAWGLRYLGSDD